jgi:hypothetical protein
LDRQTLNQYNSLKKEIKYLTEKIKRLEHKSIVKDSVTGSSCKYPYSERSFSISGIPIIPSRELKRLRSRESEAYTLKCEIEKFIDNIDDSQVRMIFEMRYFDCKSWGYISMQLGSCHESYSRKIHDKYLNKKLGD